MTNQDKRRLRIDSWVARCAIAALVGIVIGGLFAACEIADQSAYLDFRNELSAEENL